MKLFNPDNPIINALNDLTDLIILGILWLICSIPIITIGASCTALCYAYNRNFKHKEGQVTKLFFHSFAANFKQSTIVWLIMAVILAFLGADYYVSRVMLEDKPFLSVPLVAAIAITIFILMWSQYAFAYIARFEDNTKTVIKNTILIMTSNVGGRYMAGQGRMGFDVSPWDASAHRTAAMGELRQLFRPEFLNRVDEIVLFRPLEKEQVQMIAQRMIDRLCKRLQSFQYQVDVAPDLASQIAEAGFDPTYGARPLRRALQTLVEDPLAEKLLAGGYKEGDTILLRAEKQPASV